MAWMQRLGADRSRARQENENLLAFAEGMKFVTHV
jgi:hypothetical protein